MNEAIRAPDVRLVDEDGEKLGIIPLATALEMAEKADVDLVEVAPNAEPPVCRLMDYNKLQYEKQRKQKEAKKHQRQVETKEVKLRPNIDEHDYQTKLNRLREFITKGNRCKLTLTFRAREMRRFDIGRAVIERAIGDVKDVATIESSSLNRGRQLMAFLTPSKEILAAADRQFKQDLKEREKREKEEEERRSRKEEQTADDEPQS
ncbi:translation initiation factor IF-3 [bacterium]|nr:translation initiation factor IF-3 [bacterium]